MVNLKLIYYFILYMSYNSYKDGVEFRYNNRTGCFVICEEALKWSCVDGKCVQKLDGEFLTEEECIRNCQQNQKWSCRSDFICTLATTGTYNSKSECEKAGCGYWDCMDRACSQSSKGQYKEKGNCEKACSKGNINTGWIKIYDYCLCKSEAKAYYCENNCGCNTTTYYKGKGEYDTANKGSFNFNCIPPNGLNIAKSDENSKHYYAFIQFLSSSSGFSEKACGYYCKGTYKSDGLSGSDYKWHIEFNSPIKGEFSIIDNGRDPNFKGCPFQLVICKGNQTKSCQTINIINPGGTIYKGYMNSPYNIYLQYKGQDCDLNKYNKA